MGFRYRRRLGLGPFRLNLSRSGASISGKVGPVTVNPRRRSVWVNLPGGAYYQQTIPRRHVPHPTASDDLVSGVRVALHHVTNRDGIWWRRAPLPPRWHICTAWTTGRLADGALVERCACGAWRLGGGSWFDKNLRRN